MDIRTALLSMGYTEKKNNKFIKPVGYHLFFFSIENQEWVNFFKSKKGEIVIWNSHKLRDIKEGGEYIEQIKYWECFTRSDIYLPSNFEMEVFDL